MKTESMQNSIIETKHLEMLLSKNQRIDGRELTAIREVHLETGFLKKAEGSCRVRLGKSMVYAGVKAEVGTPFPDTPEEGVLIVNIELSPIASPFFESGPPTKESIELARVVDRTIRESGVLEVKKLVVTPGLKVWIVFVDLYVMADDGNLIDASTIAAMAALATTKIPEMIPDPKNAEKLIKSDKTYPIPIKTWATSITFSKIGSKTLIDPVLDEERIEEARFTVGVTEGKLVCALQKGLAGTFQAEEIVQMVGTALDLGHKQISALKKLVKNGGNWKSDEF